MTGHGGGHESPYLWEVLQERQELKNEVTRLRNELYRLRLSRDLWRNRALKEKRR